MVSAQRLTTCVSLEALATASPRSVKYLNSWDRKRRLNVCSGLKASPAGCGGGATQQHLYTELKCASGLLVDVGLESVGFGLHCSDPLQDFLLFKKTFLKPKMSGWGRAGVQIGGVTWMATPKSFPSSILGMRCWIQEDTCGGRRRSEGN